MKMRFWQKAYIFSLALFLVCLYVGIFILALFTYNNSVENAERVCRAEQNYIEMSFVRDYNAMIDAGRGANPSILMQSYGNYYKKQQIELCFTDGSRTVYNSFIELPESLIPAKGKLTQIKIAGNRHVLISNEICDGAYTMIYGKSVAELDQEFRSLVITYTAVTIAVSVFLAVVLLIVLKRLSVPLEKLRITTEKISEGNMNVSADESGKDEFSALAKSFNHMVDIIKKQMTELSDDVKRKQMLVDNMAHEMRTPLTSIRGYAEYIEKAAIPDEEKDDAARRIVSEADRLKKISEKLLDTAFLRENGVQKVPVDLAVLLHDVAEKFSQKAAENGVSLTIGTSDCVVEGDEVLLSMLFCNLTENALKACSAGGNVTLSCADMKACVADTGKGMTEEQLSHITGPFYRTDKSRSRAEGGAGLGLALCRQIVESHGARMRFESKIGEGTKVFLDFATPTHI